MVLIIHFVFNHYILLNFSRHCENQLRNYNNYCYLINSVTMRISSGKNGQDNFSEKCGKLTWYLFNWPDVSNFNNTKHADDNNVSMFGQELNKIAHQLIFIKLLKFGPLRCCKYLKRYNDFFSFLKICWDGYQNRWFSFEYWKKISNSYCIFRKIDVVFENAHFYVQKKNKQSRFFFERIFVTSPGRIIIVACLL